METLTDKQIKTRWVTVKKQINERQLLAYRVGIPLEKWDSYMYSTPSVDEINRIYHAIQEDRKLKTTRVKNGLSKLVGYREANEFSRKSGVSNTSIRDIIEGKKTMAGYDVINRLELFLSVALDDFEVSIENPLTVKNYSRDYLGEIAAKIYRIADGLKIYSFELNEMARKQELKTDWDGAKIPPSRYIQHSINRLSELQNDIDSFWKVYIDKSI